MRHIVPKFALGLAFTLLLLIVQLPQETTAQALITVIYAVTALESIISGLVAEMRASSASGTVTTKVWMHVGDPRMNGCGLYFRAEGHSGGAKEGWFPRKMPQRCGQDEYLMRMTSQSANYGLDLHLGNDQVRRLEVHADGWHDTYVNTLCFGLSQRTIVAGPRAFCIDNDLLKACKAATNRWGNLNLEYNDIKFTRTSRGIHKIIINNVPEVVQSYEAFGRDVEDTEAASKICGNIKLIRGKAGSDMHSCTGKKKYQSHGVLGWSYYDDKTKTVHKNPYGCRRFEDN